MGIQLVPVCKCVYTSVCNCFFYCVLVRVLGVPVSLQLVLVWKFCILPCVLVPARVCASMCPRCASECTTSACVCSCVY